MIEKSAQERGNLWANYPHGENISGILVLNSLNSEILLGLFADVNQRDGNYFVLKFTF